MIIKSKGYYDYYLYSTMWSHKRDLKTKKDFIGTVNEQNFIEQKQSSYNAKGEPSNSS